MDLRKLKKLIDLVEESGIAEIEVTEGEEKVRITRSLTAPQPVYAAAPAVAAAPAPAAAAAAPAAAAGAPAAPERDLSKAQTSPMVGTFYRAPGPNAPVCGSGPERERRRHLVHHRSHEADERNRSRTQRRGERNSGGKRPAGRVWRAAVYHRIIFQVAFLPVLSVHAYGNDC